MPNRGPRINPALVGFISAAVMFAALFFAFTNVSLFQSTLQMKAQVASADTLAPGADVQVAGVKVGTVKSIEKGSPGALVTLTVDTKKITMYKNASLQIRPHGVFGPKFVEINPGIQTAGDFPGGGTIPLENTMVAVDFEAILNSLDENTRTSLQTFLYEFGTGSQNRGQDFGQTIDSLQTVTAQLTPPLQVIDNRSLQVGNLFENNAVVVETYANSPIYQIIAENNDFLAQLDAHSSDVSGVVVHGNNVLGALDTVTSGNNVNNLRQVLVLLPGFADQLQRFSNDLGFGVNSLAPVIIPQHGQQLSDIELAVRRTKDAFGQCDIVDNSNPAQSSAGASDTPHANFVKIVPCAKADGTRYSEVQGGKTVYAHHSVNVLLGLHLSPAAHVACPASLGVICSDPSVLSLLNMINVGIPGLEEEGAVLCGPNTRNMNAAQTPGAAFSCKNDPLQSAPIPPAGSPPPPLFGKTAAISSNAQGSTPGIMAQPAPMSYSDLLLGY